MKKIILFFSILLLTISVHGAAVVPVDKTGGEVLVGNVIEWSNCVAKGTQLIDMAHNGSYITFEVQASETGQYDFTAAIATTLDQIGCVLGIVDDSGNYTDADTLSITNNGSWTSTLNYAWVFNLTAGTKYKFKMTCLAGSGYALNAYTVKITPHGDNVLPKKVEVNGVELKSTNADYQGSVYFDNDLSVKVSAVSLTAKVTYTALCNEVAVAISTNGLIQKSSFKNGDKIKVTATIKDGAAASAIYTIHLDVNDILTRQILGTTVNEGIWTSLTSTNFLKSWTDYFYTMTPTETSYRFYNSSWTSAAGTTVYCMYASKSKSTLAIPSNYKITSISVIGYGPGAIKFNSKDAQITALVDSIFQTTASATNPGELKFSFVNHTPGEPIELNVNTSYARFYLILYYQEKEDTTAPSMVLQNIKNGDVLTRNNGYISLRYNEAVQRTSNVQAFLNGEPVNVVVENDFFAKAYFENLNFNSQNTFLLKANSVKDKYGNVNAEDVSISFSVGSKIPVTKKLFNFVVGVNGTMDQAIAAANAASGTSRYYIFVPNGTYELTGNDGDRMSSLNRSYVSIIGQSKDSAVISNTPVSYGISNTATIHLNNVKYTYMEDLTLKNNRGEAGGGQQVVLYDRGSQNTFKTVKLFSFQDTYVSGDRAYWDNCDIYGSTDYICGGGDVFFDRCLLYNRAESGTKITAPATSTSNKWGYVFQNCTIQGGKYTLGRPWQGEPRSYFLNSIMNRQPEGTGWDGMSGLITHFYEYNSKDESGNLMDLSARGNSPSSTNKYVPVLTDAEALSYNKYNVLNGADGWSPWDLTVQTGAPKLTVAGGLVGWENNEDAICTFIFKDGKYLTHTVENSITLTDNGNYTFQFANAMGGLGAPTNVVVSSTGIQTVKFDEKVTSLIFDLQGRVMDFIPEQGFYIQNGVKYYSNKLK